MKLFDKPQLKKVGYQTQTQTQTQTQNDSYITKNDRWAISKGQSKSSNNGGVEAVCLAVEEYQRLHTPISAAKSDYERYILSLPDRSDVFWQHIMDTDLSDLSCADTNFAIDLHTNLEIALLPDSSDPLSQEIKTNYIQGKNRVIPNDHELTRWMQDWINDSCGCYTGLYEIKYCKIFQDPEILEDPGDKEFHEPAYIVVVHFSIPKGYWHAYEI